MNILGIETSCDDTSVAVVECCPPSSRKVRDFGRVNRILSSAVSSQTKLHAPFGGVVPNLAARAHLKNIRPVFNQALKQADNPKIDLIAATVGPGLIPSLLVGVNFAKALAYNLKKPIVGVNHLEGHLYANWINPIGKKSKIQNPKSKKNFPALCLIVSGGHTQLVLMKDHGQYQLLGETRDDAAGEAFDKVAKLLGLGYPGGPAISACAEKFPISNFQFPKISFPRPMIDSKNYDFSFSGLKTAVLYQIKNLPKLTPKLKTEISYEFQQAAVNVLIAKTIKAAKEFKVRTVMLSGGVAANQELRKQMKKKAAEIKTGFYAPDPEFCTDNAAMIAAAACFKKEKAQLSSWAEIQADANLRLT